MIHSAHAVGAKFGHTVFMNKVPLCESHHRIHHIKILMILVASLTLAGCMPDPLADRISSLDDKTGDLASRDCVLKIDLDTLDKDLQVAKKQGIDRGSLLEQRAAIVKERAACQHDLKLVIPQRNRLVSEWERKHIGQKYQIPYNF